jgi:hypothetical protein
MSLIPPSAPGAAQKEFKPRLAVATVVVGLAFVVLLGRLFQLQILRGDEYKGKADENFVKEIRRPADRGLIEDRNRRVLVDSRPSYDVTLTPYFCGKQCDDIISRLAAMLSLSQEEVDRVIEEACKAGATIGREPAVTFWGGYSGIFIDPDGYPWEVAHHPRWTIEEDGALTIPRD